MAEDNNEITKEKIESQNVDSGNSETKDPKLEEKKERNKKIIRSILFLVANVIVVLVLLFIQRDSSDEMVDITEFFRLLRIHPFYTIYTISTFLLLLIIDFIMFMTLTKTMGIKGRSIQKNVNVSIIGRYYDRITPWAIGGEPLQIAYFTGHGMKIGEASSVTMARHIIRFFPVSFAVIIVLIASRVTTDWWIMLLAILSVCSGLIVPSFMLLCAIKPKIGFKIGEKVIALLFKMKIIKSQEKYLEKMHIEVQKFVDGLRILWKHKFTTCMLAILALIEMFVNNAAPYFTIRALGVETTFWEIFVLCIFCNYASSIVPTPGGSGMAEFSFYAVFAAYIGEAHLFWAVLLWRIAVYYLPILVGFFVQIGISINTIRKTKKVVSD